MFPPGSTWEVPAELPDWRGRVLALDTENKDDGLARDVGPGWVGSGASEGWIVGVGAAVDDAQVYLPLRHPDTENLDRDAVVRWIKDHVRAAPSVVFQNAHYDLGWLGTDMGVTVPDEKIEDTMGVVGMLDENRLSYSLAAMCRDYGVPGKDEAALREAATAFGYDPKKDLWRLPARYVGPYGEQDPRSTLDLFAKCRPMLDVEGTGPAYRLEMDLVNMVVAMRRRGIRVDMDEAQRVRRVLAAKTAAVLSELTDKMKIGRQVEMRDVNSPRFLERAFEAERIPFPRTEKTEQGSFTKEWMADHEHWLPRLVASAAKYHDAGEKFVAKFIQEFAHRGRIHAEVHQYRSDDGGTRSYRFSYSDPPLQQMPHRDEELRNLIRGIFLPEEGEVWAAADYSQQEYRLIVHFASVCGVAGADRARQKYLDDPHTDFHMMVVDLTGLERKPAKDTNFAKAFGAGVPKFAAMTGKSIEEARAIYDQYDREMPFVSRLAEFCQARAERRGYLRLIDGARSHFEAWEPRWRDWKKEREALLANPTLQFNPCSREEAMARCADKKHPWYRARIRRAFTHKSMNRLIQGSAARMTKLAMRACWQEGLLPLLQMHDELDFSVSEERQALRAVELMRGAVNLRVPVVVDLEFGATWGRANKVEEKGTKRVLYGATYKEARAEARAT